MADLNINKSDSSVAYENVGNLVPNGDFEIAPSFTAATATAGRFIDGTSGGSVSEAGYVWAVATSGLTATANAQFDSSVSHSGSNSMKLTTVDATGAVTVSTLGGAAGLTTMYQTIPIVSNVTYTLTAWCKTNNVATNSAFIDIREYNSAGTALVTSNTNKLSGTNDWTLLTKTITANASTTTFTLFLRNNVVGNIGNAWFDDIAFYPVSRQAGVDVLVTPIITPGIQNVSGPKIWS
jgi:hypothetical protein